MSGTPLKLSSNEMPVAGSFVGAAATCKAGAPTAARSTAAPTKVFHDGARRADGRPSVVNARFDAMKVEDGTEVARRSVGRMVRTNIIAKGVRLQQICTKSKKMQESASVPATKIQLMMD